MLIYGINPATEALRAGTLTKLLTSGAGARVARLADRARAAGVVVEQIDAAGIERLAPGAAHQGVAAEVVAQPRCTVRDLVQTAAPLIVVLDGIEDPRNLGAIARTAEAAGASGLIHQTRRAAPLGAAARKASAGALAHLPCAPVVNISQALVELRRAGVWTVGLDQAAEQPYHSLDLTGSIALVLGAEGRGLRRLVRERCDWLASIPMHGRVASLNVAVAAGIALFEVLRQREAQPVDVPRAAPGAIGRRAGG